MGNRRRRLQSITKALLLLMIICVFRPNGSSADGAERNAKHLYQDLFSVSFPSEAEGWACGRRGTVLHSRDGGNTWAYQDSGTDYTLTSICFIDSRHGWAVGDGGTIIHSEDGGVTWAKQQPPLTGSTTDGTGEGEEGENQGGRLKSFFMKVHFADKERGWIVTEKTTILRTNNGGNDWRVQFTDEDFILKSISFCDDQHGWAVGEFGYIYHTENGGEKWEHQAGRFGISEETGDMEGENYLFDVVAVDPKTAWVVGIDGYVAKTVDSGKSWQEVREGIPSTHLYGIAVNNRNFVVIGGNGELLRSGPRGEGFSECDAAPPVRYGWIYDVALRGDAGLVSVGKDGWIYVGDREGLTWRRVLY